MDSVLLSIDCYGRVIAGRVLRAARRSAMRCYFRVAVSPEDDHGRCRACVTPPSGRIGDNGPTEIRRQSRQRCARPDRRARALWAEKRVWAARRDRGAAQACRRFGRLVWTLIARPIRNRLGKGPAQTILHERRLYFTEFWQGSGEDARGRRRTASENAEQKLVSLR